MVVGGNGTPPRIAPPQQLLLIPRNRLHERETARQREGHTESWLEKGHRELARNDRKDACAQFLQQLKSPWCPALRELKQELVKSVWVGAAIFVFVTWGIIARLAWYREAA